MEFIDLKTRLARVREQVDQRIAAVLDHGQFILGPEVAELVPADENRIMDIGCGAIQILATKG